MTAESQLHSRGETHVRENLGGGGLCKSHAKGHAIVPRVTSLVTLRRDILGETKVGDGRPADSRRRLFRSLGGLAPQTA